eukprot:TRINITY_DN4947_c0_g1_i1.p1 TRINITY_DN4947_c0_g1~~TRINITY_DN4947_c0_g1_i1.p1  ORF type:complete len:623 (+),score=220.02 TRINITY_DN4947_c0_g1_i1:30-1898(+)
MNLFEIPPSHWSEKRKKAYLKREKNPNSYYFRYKDPNEEIRKGPFTQMEKEAFIHRLKEVGPQNWGIFSRMIEGRVGYQCSNFYKYLVSRGEIEEIRNFKKKKVVNGQKKPRLRWMGKKDKQNERTFHDECTINGDPYRVNDIVLLRSSNDMPRIARIEAMYSKKPGRKLFKCRWFYRFEDLQIEDDKVEQNEFDDRELFLSSIYSIRNLEDVIRKGYVYQKSDFLKLTTKDIEKLELDSECECVFYSDKYFNGQINFKDDCSEEDEELEMLKTEEMKTESLINYPINFDLKQEQHIFTKKEIQESPPSTNKKISANKKNVTKDTIYCCIEGCKNICWTKRLASNLKNHWDLKEGGKYICGTHYNKDKKQKMNNTGNSSNGSNNNHNLSKNAPIKKRKLPDKDDLCIINQNNVIIHSSGHSQGNGINGISSHSLYKNHPGHNGNHTLNTAYNFNNNNFPFNHIQSNPLKNNINNNLNKNFISNNNLNHHNNNTNININSNIPSSTKKIKKNPVSQVRGVVVYKDKIVKENAIGEVIIFPNTTIEEMKEAICSELKQDLPFDLKRCHIPIPESQYQKLAYLFFNDRVEDSLVIVPSFKKEGLFSSPTAGRDFLGLLSVVNQIN